MSETLDFFLFSDIIFSKLSLLHKTTLSKLQICGFGHVSYFPQSGFESIGSNRILGDSLWLN